MNKEIDITCSMTSIYDVDRSVCFMELQEALSSSQCSQNWEDPVMVVNNAKNEAYQLFKLDFIDASEDCKNIIIPFLCLHLFGLCSHSGVAIQPTSSHCKEIRDLVCQIEWARTLQHGINLPDCDSFPLESNFCLNASTDIYKLGKLNRGIVGEQAAISCLECKYECIVVSILLSPYVCMPFLRQSQLQLILKLHEYSDYMLKHFSSPLAHSTGISVLTDSITEVIHLFFLESSVIYSNNHYASKQW